MAHPLRRSKAHFRQRRIPGKYLVFGYENVCMPVAGEVHKAEVGIVPVEGRCGLERHERRPLAVLGAFVVASEGPVELDQVDLPISRQIQELLPRDSCTSQRRLLRYLFDRREASRYRLLPVVAVNVGGAEVALVEPPFSLFAQDT